MVSAIIINTFPTIFTVFVMFINITILSFVHYSILPASHFLFESPNHNVPKNTMSIASLIIKLLKLRT